MQLHDAQKQLEELVKLQPNFAYGWNLLIPVYARQQKWAEAEHAADKAKSLGPTDPVIAHSIKRLNQALALSKTAVDGEAETYAREAQIQILLGAPEAARRILDPAMQWMPTAVPLVMTYARSYVADKRFDLAEALLLRTAELDPNHKSTWSQALANLQAARPQTASAIGAE
ncbi:MAG: tetratricopeptide repeat protein [Myxococcales bacterium]|nr:MAG: tetratricopeptide repeat protein [Myxococcales bacterium]